LAQTARHLAFLPLASHTGSTYRGVSGNAGTGEGVPEMNGFEITELGQIREQEHMLERARSQALGRARDVDAGTGRLTRPRRSLHRRLVSRLAGSR
jgi:hypothetical protein